MHVVGKLKFPIHLQKVESCYVLSVWEILENFPSMCRTFQMKTENLGKVWLLLQLYSIYENPSGDAARLLDFIYSRTLHVQKAVYILSD